MEEDQVKELKKIRKHRLNVIIIVILIVFVLGVAAFSYFRIITEGRLILRQGKNVKLALDMMDIEYYRENKSVYNPNSPNGLSSGVEQQLYDIVGQTGEVEVLSYDTAERRILYMIYEEENYRVIYKYDDVNGDQWKVDYLMTIFDYSY